MAKRKFTQISVLPATQKKLTFLKPATGLDMYEMVEAWADTAWEQAKEKGLVTDAMIQPEKPSPSKKNRAQARNSPGELGKE